MEVLFVSPETLTSETILGGNVDIDKYLPCILSAQISNIEPLLGTLLYDKIADDFEADTLSGLYLTLFIDYVKPITKNIAIAEYIEISQYMLTNGGLYKHTAENSEVVSKEEVLSLAGKYRSLAQMYIQRFEKWICKNPLPEYKCYQDEVNASKNVNTSLGWYFGTSNNKLKNYDCEWKESNL